MTNEKRHEELLDGIIEIELDMFQRVKTAGPSLCQEWPRTFQGNAANDPFCIVHRSFAILY